MPARRVSAPDPARRLRLGYTADENDPRLGSPAERRGGRRRHRAVALSGAMSHIAGCLGSKVIVAINKDKEANIFSVAHFGIVADYKEVLPALTAKLKELLSA